MRFYFFYVKFYSLFLKPENDLSEIEKSYSFFASFYLKIFYSYCYCYCYFGAATTLADLIISTKKNNILDRTKNSRLAKNSQPVKKKLLDRQKNSRPTRTNLEISISILKWWNDIWACYPIKNNLDHFCPLWLSIRDAKKQKKTRFRGSFKTPPRFRDRNKNFRDPEFSG